MTDTVAISDLRHRVRIERPERAADGAGGWNVTWTLVDEVWAAMWPRMSSEQFALDRVAGKATHDIWMRYRRGVTPGMRITIGTRVFDILGALDVRERRRWLKCIAEERDL